MAFDKELLDGGMTIVYLVLKIRGDGFGDARSAGMVESEVVQALSSSGAAYQLDSSVGGEDHGYDVVYGFKSPEEALRFAFEFAPEALRRLDAAILRRLQIVTFTVSSDEAHGPVATYDLEGDLVVQVASPLIPKLGRQAGAVRSEGGNRSPGYRGFVIPLSNVKEGNAPRPDGPSSDSDALARAAMEFNFAEAARTMPPTGLPFGLTLPEATAYRLTIAKVPVAEIASRLKVTPSQAQGLVDEADRKLGDRLWSDVLEAMPELGDLSRYGESSPPPGGYPGSYQATYSVDGHGSPSQKEIAEAAFENGYVIGANPDETASLNSEFGDMVVTDDAPAKAVVFFEAKLSEYASDVAPIYEHIAYVSHEAGSTGASVAAEGIFAFSFATIDEAVQFAIEDGPEGVTSSSSDAEPEDIAAYFAVMPPGDLQPYEPSFVFGTVEIDLAHGFGLPNSDPRTKLARQTPDCVSLRLDLRDRLQPLRWDTEQDDLPLVEHDEADSYTPLGFDGRKPYGGIFNAREEEILHLTYGSDAADFDREIAERKMTPERAHQVKESALAKIKRLSQENRQTLFDEMGIKIPELEAAERQAEVVAEFYFDPDVVTPQEIADLVHAISRAYGTIGGSPLSIRDGGTGTFEEARVPSGR